MTNAFDFCVLLVDEVTDHGNLSCGRRLKNGRWVEYWSVV